MNTVEEIIEKAKICIQTREYEKGINYCNEALEINPKDSNANCILGGMYVTRGNYDKKDFDRAIEFCTKAIRLDRKNLLSIHGAAMRTRKNMTLKMR